MFLISLIVTILALLAWQWAIEPALVLAIATFIGLPGATLSELPNVDQILIKGLRIVLMFEVVGRCLILLSIPPHFRPQVADPDQFRGLDQPLLETYTQELTQLGFKPLQDYTLKGIYGMARLFVHPEQQCFAEVNQVVGATPLCCNITSLMVDRWTLSTANHRLMAAMYVFQRLPRNILISSPTFQPQDLLKLHLQTRSQMLMDLGIQLDADLSRDRYFQQELWYRQQWRTQIMRKSILVGLGEMIQFWLFPKLRWMGDYPDIAIRRCSQPSQGNSPML